MANKDTVAIRKRAQIAKANRTMFMWVALASVVVSVAVVLMVMMWQRGAHNQRAISELNKTVDTLEQNNENVPEIENQVRMLGSNPALLRLRTNDNDNALRVILDALPAEPNPSALGASLQEQLFEDITVESVQITPVLSGDEFTATGEGSDANGLAASAISFQFVVRGNPAQLKELLTRLERSIRTIQISQVNLEGSGDSQTLSVNGEAYYLPARQLQLNNLDIKP